jgi:O-antigen/teichoic acid export membrane protein
MLRQSFPYALLILLMMIYNRMDSIMLERLLPNGSVEAGIYAQGYRLLDAVNMFALLFAGLLLPIFSRMIAKKQSISSLLSSSSLVLLSIATIVSIGGLFYSEIIISSRYIEDINASSHAFSILILSFIPVSVTYIYGTLLTANGSLKQLNQMALGGLTLNFFLNYFLIPEFGATGAAVSTLLTQSLTAFIQLILAYRIVKLTPNIAALTKFFIFVVISFGTFLLLKPHLPNLFGFLSISSTLFVIAMLVGVIPVKDALKLIRKAG